MNASVKLLAALGAIVLIGVCALVIDGAPGSAASAQRKLERSAAAALGSGDSGWAAVAIDGQKAVLSGAARDEEARAALIARIRTAEGRGGLLMGGITAVDASALTIAETAPVADPFIFIAEREGDALVFSGHVPDQESRDAVFALAAELYPDTDISGELDIADGAPAAPGAWRNAAETSLRALYYLRNGAISAEGPHFTLTGEAEDDVRASAARMLINALAGGLSGEAHIAVPGEVLSQESELQSAQPEAREAPLQAPAPVPCADRLRQEVSRLDIRYSSADSGLNAASQEQLRVVASLLTDCPAARLEITGHTDSRGRGAGNLLLSRERAYVVRAFLVSAGAPENRIAADGAGEAEPIASNATEAGRERNRRIEFEIISD